MSKYIKNHHFDYLETVFWAPGPKIRIFPDMRFSQAVSLYCPLTSHQKSEKSLARFSRKNSKTPFFVHFGHFWLKICPRGKKIKKRFLSLFYPYTPLTSCTKSEKSLEPIPLTLCYGRTDGLTSEGGYDLLAK